MIVTHVQVLIFRLEVWRAGKRPLVAFVTEILHLL